MLEHLIEYKGITASVVVSLATSFSFILKYYLQLFYARRCSKNKGFVMQIIPPKYTLEETGNIQGHRFALQRFMDNLTAAIKKERISFEIFANEERIKFLIWSPSKEIQNMIKLNLYSTYQERIKIQELDNDPLEIFNTENSYLNEYKAVKHYIYTLMDVKDFEAVDPVQHILSAMTGLEKDEALVSQIIIKPTKLDKYSLKKAKEHFRLGKSEISWTTAYFSRLDVFIIFFIPLLPVTLLKLLSGLFKVTNNNQNLNDPVMSLPDTDPRKIIIEKDELKDFSNHLSEKYKTAFSSYIRVAYKGKKVKERLQGIEQSLEVMKSETQNRLIKKNSKNTNALINRFLYPDDQIFPFHLELFTSQNILSSREISMLFHLPKQIYDPSIEHFVMPEIPVNKKFRNRTNKSDLLLGINKSRGKEYKAYFLENDRRRHLSITGQTGTGKSTILKNLVLQDIDGRLLSGEKRGLMLLDPHEDFFMDILQRIPYSHRDTNKLIAWDTRDEESYFGFNPLYAVGLSEREIDLIVDSNFKLIEKTIRRQNPEGGMGATGKPMLINAMKTLMVFQNTWLEQNGNTPYNRAFISRFAPTLVDVKGIFSSDEFEQNILSFINLEKYEGLRSFWQETLPNYKESKNWPEIRQGFDNKISQILTGILLYTFGQSESSIDVSDIIRDSKILLVNLASQNIGEEGMSLLGSLLMAKVWFEAKRIRQNTRRPFVVYADEFQNFATSDFASALSEARKFKLELILAHQFFQQLPDDVFHAVMGNVKSKIYYRCGLEDAEMIAEELQGKILKQELMEIPEFHANVKVGENVFSLYVPEERKPSVSTDAVEEIIENNYFKYGKTKTDIEKQIQERRNWIRDGCQAKQVNGLEAD